MAESLIEQRVRAVESSLSHVNAGVGWAKWLGGGAIVAAALAFLQVFGSQAARIEGQERELSAIKESHNRELDSLKERIDKVDERLRGWESRGFRVVQAVVQDGVYVSVEGDRIAIRNGQGVKMEFKGLPKHIELAKTLKPETKIRFMESDASPGTLIVFALP